MGTAATAKRKLIDIQATTFNTLSEEASRRRISLKKYIENLLEEEALSIKRQHIEISPNILRLVGSALPKDRRPEDIDDDRLRYILSK